MKRQRILVPFLFSIVISISFIRLVNAQSSPNYPETYRNLRFWNGKLDYCFSYQETNVSCIPAAVQMMLKYLNVSYLPSQSELANEMKTNINHTTKWEYTYIPFEKRGFHEYFNQSLVDDFNQALFNLKGNVSRNFPVMVMTWYDENVKNNDMTHARVVTGYDSAGVFLHDPSPYMGSNIYLNNSVFQSLWETDYGFWALIIKHEPVFDLIIRVMDVLGLPIANASVTLSNRVKEIGRTNSEGMVRFENIPISKYYLTTSWGFETKEDDLAFSQDRIVYQMIVWSERVIILVSIASVVIAILLVGFASIRRMKKSNSRI